ncbi:phosphatidate cytidylyltransferase [Sediminibacterium ginsengisoli]|uniref:Phosphatidate cytidylyltransferase n=1 Tax=Sediminibacterium ginsengisoli TaxID=413434 RepID=A0A1T4Q2G9_9BACT|nr:phosphatidate cytidylyltransferase [Sediminibacterium ginsengisoli]SJZ97737.1 hypothetical protein SAMN04488132_10797 [Sediminibacterium ginsengisoli]
MKKNLAFTLLSILLFTLSGCAAIEGIFKAGMWTGILAVFGVVVLIIIIIGNITKKK